MAQFIPYRGRGESLSEANIGGQLSHALQTYQEHKQRQAQDESFKILADPNSTAQQKSQAILKTGSIQDLLKFQQQQQTQADVKRYEAATGMGGKRFEGGGPAQVNDQDVGGQANEQAVADIQPGPQAGAPTETKDVVKAKTNEPPEIDEDEVDAAITSIAAADPQLASVLQRQEATKRKNSIANQKAIDHSYELTQDFRTGVTGELESAESTDNLIDRMVQLSDEQESTPAFVTLMQKIGVPTSVFGNPSEEEIEKISNEMLKSIPAGWKGKILQSEFHALMRTVPTLLNSPEGKKIIARNMKLLLVAPAEIKYEAMREVTKQYLDNNKKLPADFVERVKEATKSKMAFLKKEFLEGSQDAISLSERLEKGGTSRYRSVDEEKIKNNPAITEKLKTLNPVPSGKVRYAWEDGKIFDMTPEEAAIATKKHPNLIKVS